MTKSLNELFQEVNFVRMPKPDLLTQRELSAFEEEMDIKLPKSYQDFCMQVGSGRFSNDVVMECVSPSRVRENLEALKLDLCISLESNDLAFNINEVVSLVHACLPFALPDAQTIVWDLRTYQIQDDSYDIYLLPFDPLDRIYFVGRSFLEFIDQCCLGDRLIEITGDYSQPRIEKVGKRFCQFPLDWTSPM